VTFRNQLILYDEELAVRQTPPGVGPPLVVCPKLLIHYIRSYPPYLEAVSSVRNLRTRHAVVTRDPLKLTILPDVLYGRETWPLTLREEHKHTLRVLENRVLRIFWRKRY
jgi:hypothetical protein